MEDEETRDEKNVSSIQYFGMLPSPFAYSFAYTRTVDGMRSSVTPTSPLALHIMHLRQQQRRKQRKIRLGEELE